MTENEDSVRPWKVDWLSWNSKNTSSLVPSPVASLEFGELGGEMRCDERWKLLTHSEERTSVWKLLIIIQCTPPYPTSNQGTEKFRSENPESIHNNTLDRAWSRNFFRIYYLLLSQWRKEFKNQILLHAIMRLFFLERENWGRERIVLIVSTLTCYDS